MTSTLQMQRVGLRPPWHRLQRGWVSRCVRRTGLTRSLTGLALGSGLLSVALLGCGSDTTGPAPQNPTHLPWRLVLNHHAVTLLDSAPYDTVQLIPTVTTVTGAAVPGSVTVSYTTSDASGAVVDAHGLVTARGASNAIQIIAAATAGGVLVQDTLHLVVNAAASLQGSSPTLPTALKLQSLQNFYAPLYEPAPPAGEGPTVDCEVSGPPDMRNLWLVPELLTGATPLYTVPISIGFAPPVNLLNNVAVSYTSSNPSLLSVTERDRNGSIASIIPVCETSNRGTVVIRATATVYGITVSDSVVVTAIPALTATVGIVQLPSRTTGQPINVFSPDSVTIAAGGLVKWRVDTTLTPHDSIDVVFDHPPGPVQGVDSTALGSQAFSSEPYPFESAGGNIAAFMPTDTLPDNDGVIGVRARQFPVPGTYHYHSARYGTAGVIVVLSRTATP